MANCNIKLFDRVKQKSIHAAGTGDIQLNSSVNGFNDFADVYSDQDKLFYCINDGSNFEVGSGVFNSGTVPTIQRNVFYSSASDNSAINFATSAIKEVFVTYPATHSVIMGSGITGLTLPQKSGVAFWNCNNILDYDNNFIWDKDSKYLGIRRFNPSYAIDIGGDGSSQSMIRASGYHVGPTGIHFPSGNGDEAAYTGGIQFQHFVKNEVLGADSQSVLGTSGIVNQQLYFKPQSAGLFFAGPASGCTPTPCSPNIPNFRPITLDDVPYIEEVSGYLQTNINDNAALSVSGEGIVNYVPLWSGVKNLKSSVIYELSSNIGIGNTNPQSKLDVSGVITGASGVYDVLDMNLLENGSQPTHAEGLVFYDSESHALVVYNDESEVTQQLGQEEYLRVRNNTGYTIFNGSGVRITGAHGNAAPTIDYAIASGDASSRVVGLATHDIENNSFGYVTTFGIVRDVNTSDFSAGDELYLSATSSGTWTNTSPVIPNFSSPIGYVIRSHGNNGSVLVELGKHKLGGGDLKSEAAVVLSGVPFVTSVADTTAGGLTTVNNFVYDSGNDRLGIATGSPSQTLSVSGTVDALQYFKSGVPLSLDSLDDVQLTLPIDNDSVLTYSTSDGVFKNTSPETTNTTSVYDLGLIFGVTDIHAFSDQQIQTCEFDGTSITFEKGAGWTTSPTDSKDVFLIMSGVIPTTVNFDLVNHTFYNKPELILNSGEHSIIFRSFGSKISGYYLGSGVSVTTTTTAPTTTTTTTTTGAGTTTTTTGAGTTTTTTGAGTTTTTVAPTTTTTTTSAAPASITQLGSDIDGEAAGDYSGWSVSFNSAGSRVAIAAYANDGAAINAGHVRIYDWSGSAWTQVGSDIDGEATGDRSGYSVSLSSDGSRVAIGASYNDGAAINAGHVRIYDWSGSAWTQVGTDIDGEADTDRSGYSVSLSSDGSRVAIGAPYNDGTGSYSGHVRIYDWSGSAWTQVGSDIDGEATSDRSGVSVSLSSDGSRVAIGAHLNDGSAGQAGHVRIYDWSGSAWTQVGTDIDGEAGSDRSGVSVSLSSDGSRVAIGAYLNDGAGGDAGHVRIYDWSGSAWTQVGSDIDGEDYDDESGYSVSLSSDGSRVAIGAPYNDGAGASAGHVRIYDWSGSAWTQVGTDIDGEAAGDRSGWSVSLSGDGHRVAIGATINGEAGIDAGHVRVYAIPSSTTTTTTAAP